MGTPPHETSNNTGLSFSTTLSIGPVGAAVKQVEEDSPRKVNHRDESEDMNGHGDSLSPKPNLLSLQLDLFPRTPAVPRTSNLPLSFTWAPSTENVEQEEGEEGPAVSSSPNNSAASSLQMDLCIYSKGLNQYGKRGSSGEGCDQRASSRASDEDDNNSVTRKKLRLSKEQSAFLEESFKEHSTLNPKQKLALAKQLGLRPRQVEVWFQNRRARTKLKQTEVDCEYLKRCCETLTEENRRLHKELQELRALKMSNPFYMQLPATTLTMCPSCERVATNSTSAASPNTPPSTTHSNGPSSTTATNKTNDPISNSNIAFPINRPKFYPFAHS